MGAGELGFALLVPTMVRGASAQPACSLRDTGRAEEEILVIQVIYLGCLWGSASLVLWRYCPKLGSFT